MNIAEFYVVKWILRNIVLVVLLLVLPTAALAQDTGEISVQLWRMVNYARIHPLETIHSLGIDEAAARQALGDDSWILDKGLLPLAWDDRLARAAGDHNDDMVRNLYYSSIGPDGSTVADRISRAGYHADRAEELLGAVAFTNFMTPFEAAKVIFKNWVQGELDPGATGKRRIFNPELSDMGVSLKAAVVDLGRDIPVNLYIVTADFAKPQEQRAYLFGNVYQDADGDGLMEPGEGVSGVTVIVKSCLTGAGQGIALGTSGLYKALLPQGFFTVSVFDAAGNLLAKRAGFGGDRNRWMDVRLGR